MKIVHCLMVAGILSPFISCSKQPSIKIDTTSVRAEVNIETYGEYGTSVRRAILKEKATGKIIWQIEAKSGLPHVHDLTFQLGANNAELTKVQGGDFNVVVPTIATKFQVDPKIEYVIEIWRDLDSKPSHATFQLTG